MGTASLTLVAAVLLWAAVSLFPATSPVYADTGTLSLSVDKSFCVLGQTSYLVVTGETSQSLNGGTLVVTLKGPIPADRVGAAGVDTGAAHQSKHALGGDWGAEDGGAPAGPPQGWSTNQELRQGTLKAVVTLPPWSPRTAGAYLVVAEVQAGGQVVLRGETWVGKAPVNQPALDVCFVLPVSLGIHRDQNGHFFDQILEQATLPVESGGETLRGLAPLVEGLPQWDLTLAVEPILLTQLRDMADGYVLVGPSGESLEADANDLAPQNAAAVLSELQGLVTTGSVELVASPYTGADLSLLGEQGWRDGLEQIQMGKQELQSTLGLEAPLVGCYAPDLQVTDESLSYYSDASVDHVVVTGSLRGAFAEEVGPTVVAVRAENTQTDRVTLVFADEALSDAVAPPWDVGVFSAALAARIAEGPGEALVIAPRDVFTLIPSSYLQTIGGFLTSQQWIQTQSLQELLREYPAGSRPIPLRTDPVEPQGYMEAKLFEAVKAAHVSVSDLASAADAAKNPVSRAHRLLYSAESRWWSREGVGPEEASVGLALAREAQAAAQEEMGKVRLVGADSSLMGDGSGVVRVTVENSAEYSFTAKLQVEGEDVTFPEGQEQTVELEPGRTVVEVQVAGEGGSRRIEITLLAGTSVLDEMKHSVRFMGLRAVLPWLIVVIVLLLGFGVYLWVRRRRRSPEPPSA